MSRNRCRALPRASVFVAIVALPLATAAQTQRARAAFDISVNVVLPCAVSVQGVAGSGCRATVRDSLRSTRELPLRVSERNVERSGGDGSEPTRAGSREARGEGSGEGSAEGSGGPTGERTFDRLSERDGEARPAPASSSVSGQAAATVAGAPLPSGPPLLRVRTIEF
jgi:hypothetical protein